MSDKLSSEHSNRLINESRPYLLQHATDPVDWYPWGPEALQLARERDQPVLLSIGYSACHWCHVMEQESFEDAETARVMNEKFICVKVDREERPDLRSHLEDIHFAIELADVVCERVMDKANGGFYFTSDDHENLIHRSKPGADDAILSGNGIAAKVLGRLGHLLGESRYLHAASATLNYLSGAMFQQASAYGSALRAVQEHLNESESIVIRYEDANELRQWSDALGEARSPGSFVIAIPSSANSLPGVLAHRQPHGAMTAYVCRGLACSLPVTDIASFRHALSGA